MKLKSSSRSHAQRTSGGISRGIRVRADIFRSLTKKTNRSKGANAMQRRSRGRIEVGSTDKVTSIQASLSLRLNGLENQSQVAGSILPRQACPPRAALGWPDH